MGLLAWLPLNGNLNNQGLDSLIYNGSETPTYATGKVTNQCLYNSGYLT